MRQKFSCEFIPKFRNIPMGGFQRAGTGKKHKRYRNFPPASVLAWKNFFIKL